LAPPLNLRPPLDGRKFKSQCLFEFYFESEFEYQFCFQFYFEFYSEFVFVFECGSHSAPESGRPTEHAVEAAGQAERERSGLSPPAGHFSQRRSSADSLWLESVAGGEIGRFGVSF